MNEEQNSILSAESDKKSEPSYGKFSTLEELVKAYNALESEFTRRSQKLKEYEKTYGEEDVEVKKAELQEKYGLNAEIMEEAEGIAKTQNKKLEDALLTTLTKKPTTVEEMASDEKVIDRVLSEKKNRESVIAAYLTKIKGIDAPPTLPKGGAMPTVAPIRPQTVKEAGEIAREILENL